MEIYFRITFKYTKIEKRTIQIFIRLALFYYKHFLRFRIISCRYAVVIDA